jgi:hypothetical protein
MKGTIQNGIYFHPYNFISGSIVKRKNKSAGGTESEPEIADVIEKELSIESRAVRFEEKAQSPDEGSAGQRKQSFTSVCAAVTPHQKGDDRRHHQRCYHHHLVKVKMNFVHGFSFLLPGIAAH